MYTYLYPIVYYRWMMSKSEDEEENNQVMEMKCEEVKEEEREVFIHFTNKN